MFKIAILGCENSHAANFLKVIRDENIRDVEVVGVYSSYPGEAEKLNAAYGVPVAQSYDAFVGQLDGLIITARHGDEHYRFAKPYLASGIPMFIDKPITASEADARAFSAELKANGVRVSGGSTLKHSGELRQLKALIASGTHGKPIGGFLRAPVDLHSVYGGFSFYAQHLVQMIGELFGYAPKSVRAQQCGRMLTCTLRYSELDVTGLYVDGSYVYHASVAFEKEQVSTPVSTVGASGMEFHDFYELLKGGPQPQSYEEFFAPVFIINALERALNSGNEEPVLSI